DIMRSNAAADSSSVSAAPVAALAMSALRSSIAARPSVRGRPPAGANVPGRGELEEILQDQMPVLGGDALGMELHAVDRELAMRNAHDEAFIGLRAERKLVRQAVAIDYQRMIARRLERRIDAAEHPGAAVPDLGELAVHRHRRAHDLSAERLADCLVTEAYAENRNALRGLVDQIETDARLVRRAGTRREHNRIRVGGEHVGACELVVAMHGYLRPQPAEIMDEVEGEAVVIIDQDDHRLPGWRSPGRGAARRQSAAEPGILNGLRCRAWVLVGGDRRVKAASRMWQAGDGSAQARWRRRRPAAGDDHDARAGG